MKLSIVATLYQSAPYIAEFYQRASNTAKQLVGEDYEIILVNDGSPDNSLDIAVHITESDKHVMVIDLSRNFGHHKAIMTGLSYAKGEKVFLIDTDLEEEPEWLLSFAKQMESDNCDLISGVQEMRKGGVFERWSGELFYCFYRNLTGLDIPKNTVTASLMTRRYVDALLLHEEREVSLIGLFYITGFKQIYQTVTKHSSSLSTYTLRRKISLFINSVTSFSNVPLQFIFYIGVTIFIFSCVYIIYLILNWALYDTILVGWTSVMASIWLIGGMIISFVGVVGIYLSKIFSETKKRPYTIVRQIYVQHKAEFLKEFAE